MDQQIRPHSYDFYIDEAGKAPEWDNDEILIVSGFAVPSGTDSELRIGRHIPSVTADELKSFSAVYASLMVRPRAGYGLALEEKVDAYKFITEINGKQKRPGIYFTSADQIRVKNLIWIASMHFLTGMLLMPITERDISRIEHLRFFFNAQSIQPDMKKWFEAMLKEEMHRTAKEVFLKGGANPALAEGWRNFSLKQAVKIQIKSIEVEFDSPPENFHGSPAMIKVADSLASNTWNEFKLINPTPGMLSALRERGMDAPEPMNITEGILELHRDQWIRWEKETGYRVPKAKHFVGRVT